jgi:pimeloyl-ACP methyl ester carboxylesterase
MQRSPTSHWIPINGLRLHYLAWGQAGAPTVLLLHGGSAHAHWWDWFAPAIADRLHVLALDLRGHGDSAWVDPPAYEVPEYAADVVAFLDALDVRAVRIIGHSLGGTIAATAAGQIADRMVALALVDSRIVHDQDRRASGAGVRFMHRLAQLPHPRYRSREHGIAQYRLLPLGSSARPEILAEVAGHALRRDDDGTWTFKFDRAALAVIKPHDISPALARPRCPLLIVRGALSPLMPLGAIDALRGIAPQIEVVTIDGAHHHVMLDQPEAFNRTVREFLLRTLDR